MDFASLYREERPRALATLIRLLGDFDLAEDALQDAVALALAQWPRTGWPASPCAWLVSTARHKALDRLRRERTWAAKERELAHSLATVSPPPELAAAGDGFPDDRLRLIFTCCHPALALEAQVALTLKTLCGFDVDDIARAFLATPSTTAQRLTRAKAKIRAAHIAYEVPAPGALGERLEGVLRVVYLVFTEGYAASTADADVRRALCDEAIRLAKLLVSLLPGEAEAAGLLGLLLLQDSRRAARVDAAGDLVTLEEQNRSHWDQGQIAEGVPLAESALRQGGAGFYAIQAAIAALHAQAPTADATDWPQIALLYALLLRRHPSPVVALNHAAAVGMAQGPARGLRLLEGLAATGELARYHLLPAARADLLRRAGRLGEALAAYDEALALVTSPAERRYLERRRRDVVG